MFFNYNRLGKKKRWLVFVRYIDPILIILVLIFGIVDQFKNVKDFPNGSFGVVLGVAIALIVGTIVINALINSEKFMNYYNSKKQNLLLAKNDSGQVELEEVSE